MSHNFVGENVDDIFLLENLSLDIVQRTRLWLVLV